MSNTTLTTKLQDALNAVNTGNGNTHADLASTLGVRQPAARERAKRLAKLGLLTAVNMGGKTGAWLYTSREGLNASLTDLDAKRDTARSAYVAKRTEGNLLALYVADNAVNAVEAQLRETQLGE